MARSAFLDAELWFRANPARVNPVVAVLFKASAVIALVLIFVFTFI